MTMKPVFGMFGPNDPAPVQCSNALGSAPFLLTGDHAGRHIPVRLGKLGLEQEDLDRHIACDIGIEALGLRLAARLDAPFLRQAYSRLVIDCNRAPGSVEAIPQASDGTIIPGNQALSPEHRAARVDQIHIPYQDAIATMIAARSERGLPTILVALHSFTPVMAGVTRPWDVGVLHDGANDSFAQAVLKALQNLQDICVGDNQPYRMDETDHTVPRHAFATGRPYVELEVRQDHLAAAADIELWSGRIADALLGAHCLACGER
jgi:predicted N-formylglutamate amidohydrolase